MGKLEQLDDVLSLKPSSVKLQWSTYTDQNLRNTILGNHFVNHFRKDLERCRVD